jgi:hypothetical protein
VSSTRVLIETFPTAQATLPFDFTLCGSLIPVLVNAAYFTISRVKAGSPDFSPRV